MAVPLSTDERRALAIIAALLILAGGARWLERPRPLLDGVPDIDLAALEQDSRDAKPAPRARAGAAGAGGAPATSSRTQAPSTQPAAARGATSASARPASTAAGSAGKLDPNSASAEQLATLPGVGPALAARIVEQRERAPFRSTADLTRVRGIGPAMAARLAPALSLPAQAEAPAAVDAPLGLTDAERRSAEADRQAALEDARRNAPRVAPATPAAPSTSTAARPAGNGGSLRPGSAGAAPATDAVGPIDLNRATAAELVRLPGVGPVLAAKLVARRDSIGGFRSWDDVDAVSGVGPALLDRLRRLAKL